MGIKTVPHPPDCSDLAPCDFCLFPKLRGYGYETIEEMKEAVTKVIDTLTQGDFPGAFHKLLHPEDGLVWFGLVSLFKWHINLSSLFNAKAILLEEQ